jgi:hypothetical protein
MKIIYHAALFGHFSLPQQNFERAKIFSSIFAIRDGVTLKSEKNFIHITG